MLDTRWKEYMIYYDDDNPALDMVLAGKVTEVCFAANTQPTAKLDYRSTL